MPKKNVLALIIGWAYAAISIYVLIVCISKPLHNQIPLQIIIGVIAGTVLMFAAYSCIRRFSCMRIDDRSRLSEK